MPDPPMPNPKHPPRTCVRPTTRRFDGVSHEAARAVAGLLGAPLQLEPYCESATEPVFHIDHRSEQGNLRIVLWPALARVDVRCGPHTWVAKGIGHTDVLDGVEAIFRMTAGGLLFLTVDGAVLMVSGPTNKRAPTNP